MRKTFYFQAQEGEQILVQRVLELGEDFMVMCLSRLLVAIDRTAVGLSQSGLELGQYVIFPKREKHCGHWATATYSSAQDRPGFTETAELGPSETGERQVERNEAARTEDFETLDSLLRDAGILQASANVTLSAHHNDGRCRAHRCVSA